MEHSSYQRLALYSTPAVLSVLLSVSLLCFIYVWSVNSCLKLLLRQIKASTFLVFCVDLLRLLSTPIIHNCHQELYNLSYSKLLVTTVSLAHSFVYMFWYFPSTSIKISWSQTSTDPIELEPNFSQSYLRFCSFYEVYLVFTKTRSLVMEFRTTYAFKVLFYLLPVSSKTDSNL